MDYSAKSKDFEMRDTAKNTNDGVHLPVSQRLTKWFNKSFWVVFIAAQKPPFTFFSCAFLFKFPDFGGINGLQSWAILRKNFSKTTIYTHVAGSTFPSPSLVYRCTSWGCITTHLNHLNPINGAEKGKCFQHAHMQRHIWSLSECITSARLSINK